MRSIQDILTELTNAHDKFLEEAGDECCEKIKEWISCNPEEDISEGTIDQIAEECADDYPCDIFAFAITHDDQFSRDPDDLVNDIITYIAQQGKIRYNEQVEEGDEI